MRDGDGRVVSRSLAWALCALTWALAGCAGMKTELDADGSQTGVRYYLPAWFIVAYGDANGDVVARAELLPDTTRIYSSKPYAYFAANEATLVFENGVLTSGSIAVDETMVPAAILDVAKSIAIQALGLLAALPDGKQAEPWNGWDSTPAPRLFKLVCKRDSQGASQYSLATADGGEIALPKEKSR